MTLGRTAAGKIKIKTDGTAGLRAVECGCCVAGPCGGCPALEDVLTSTSFLVTETSTGAWVDPMTGLPCIPPGPTYSTLSPRDACEASLRDSENIEQFGVRLFVYSGSFYAQWPQFSTADPSKCYVGLFWGSDLLQIFLISGPNSVNPSGTYGKTTQGSCDYFFFPGISLPCPGFLQFGEKGNPDVCYFDLHSTLTIS